MSRLLALSALLALALAAASCGGDDVDGPKISPTASPIATAPPPPEAGLPLTPDASEVYLHGLPGGLPPILVGRFPAHTQVDWSPLGQLVLISRMGSALTTIELSSSAEWKATKLTVNGEVDRLTWAPDGARLAFRRLSPGESAIAVVDNSSSTNEDLVVAAQGTTVRPVGWLSPTTLVFVQATGTLAEIDVTSGNVREISQVHVWADDIVQPVISPDGGRILAAAPGQAACREDGPGSILLIDVVTGSHSLVADGVCTVNALSWSPDGSKVAYGLIDFPEDQGGVFVFDLDGTTPRRVLPGGRDHQIWWSTDAETLFASMVPCWDCDQSKRVWVSVGTGDGTTREIGSGTTGALSPDTSILAFAKGEALWMGGTKEGAQAAEIWPADADWVIDGLAWSPRGDSLAVVRDHSYQSRGYIARLDGTGLLRLTNYDTSQASFLSPDGRKMAVIDYEPGSRRGPITIFSFDGSPPVRTVLSRTSFVRWSPDSRKFVADGLTAEKAWLHFAVIDIQGSLVLDIASDATNYFNNVGPWSPDSRFAVIASGIADTNTGEMLDAVGMIDEEGPFSWKADSSSLIFTGKADATLPAREVYAAPADGSGARPLTSDGEPKSGSSLSPDGSRLVYALQADGKIISFDLQSGEQTVLFSREVDADDRGEFLAWSPDGARIAFFVAASSGFGIYIMNSDGTGLTFWAAVDMVTELYWLDHQTLAFTTEMRSP